MRVCITNTGMYMYVCPTVMLEASEASLLSSLCPSFFAATLKWFEIAVVSRIDIGLKSTPKEKGLS